MFQHVMVPLDGSELAECVLPHVEAVAKGCQVKDVTFVRVVEPFMLLGAEGGFGGSPGLDEEQRQRLTADRKATAEDYLKQLAGKLNYGSVNLRTEVLFGIPADTLAEWAEKNNVDLIIIATHGRSGISRWVRGSVADRVLHAAHVPVLIVRAPGSVPGI